jgi:hypothetical protein
VKSLEEWVRRKPLGRTDAIGWAVRLVQALMALHELDAPHGRINARAIVAVRPSASSRAMLVDGDEVERNVQFYSVQRIKLSGASKEDDVWAIGVLLYFLATGAYPFPGSHRRQIRERIEWRPASPIEVYGVEDKTLQALLDRLFKPDEALRLASLRLLLRALLKLEPTAADLPLLGHGVVEDDEPPTSSEEPLVPSSRDPVAVANSVHALFGSDAETSPIARGQLPRGPMATLPQVSLSDDERAKIADKAKRIADERAASEKRAAPAEKRAAPVEKPSAEKPVAPAAPPPLPPARRAPPPASKPAPAPKPVRELPRLDDEDDDDEPPTEVMASRPPPRERTASAPRTAPPKAHTKTAGVATALWGVVVLLGVAAATLYFVPSLGRRVASMVTGRESSREPTAPAPAFTTVPTTVATATASVTSQAIAPVAPVLEGRDACVAGMLPEETFLSKPKLEFICTGEDPRKVSDALRIEIVLGKGTRSVTDAMKLWTELGWYQHAFVAAARSRCCPPATPSLQSDLGGPPCRFDAALSDLGFAVAEGEDDHLDKALVDFEGAMNCLAKAPTKTTYGFASPPGGAEAETFKSLVARIRNDARSAPE